MVYTIQLLKEQYQKEIESSFPYPNKPLKALKRKFLLELEQNIGDRYAREAQPVDLLTVFLYENSSNGKAIALKRSVVAVRQTINNIGAKEVAGEGKLTKQLRKAKQLLKEKTNEELFLLIIEGSRMKQLLADLGLITSAVAYTQQHALKQ